jgi:hypothetical protein
MKAKTLDAETSLAWRRMVRRARYGDDIHITSDKRRDVILKVDALLCALRLKHATQPQKGETYEQLSKRA